MPRPADYVRLPADAPGLRAELERLDREIAATPTKSRRRVLAIERRRVVVALDRVSERLF